MSELVQQGIAAVKAGNKAQARRLLGRAIQEDPRSEQAWLWLSAAVDDDQERLTCLDQVLAINPDNEMARRGAAALRQKIGQPAQVGPPEAPVLEPVPGKLDHSQSLEELSPERQQALRGCAQLIAYELAQGQSKRKVIEQLTKRGFPRKAVQQLVAQIAPLEAARPSDRLPIWSFVFVLLCAAIPFVALGGVIPALLGTGGGFGCMLIARKSSIPVVVRVVLCAGLTVLCWVMFIVAVIATARIFRNA